MRATRVVILFRLTTTKTRFEHTLGNTNRSARKQTSFTGIYALAKGAKFVSGLLEIPKANLKGRGLFQVVISFTNILTNLNLNRQQISAVLNLM
jgi:hypothetical protein